MDHAALRQLKALEAPVNERRSVNALLVSLERSTAAMDDQVSALRAGRADTEAAIVRRYEGAYNDLALAAASVGLSECQGVGN